MPVIRNAYSDSIYILPEHIEHFTPIPEKWRVFEPRKHRTDTPGIHITQSNDAPARSGQTVYVGYSPSCSAYCSNLHSLVCSI